VTRVTAPPEARKPERWRYIFHALPLAPQAKPSFNEADVSDKPPSLRRPRMTAEDVAALTWQYRTRLRGRAGRRRAAGRGGDRAQHRPRPHDRGPGRSGPVRNHVSAILGKLDVADRTQAALLALRFGLVDAGDA
jgi:hypothetical protein